VLYDAEGTHYHPFILKDTEVGSDAEGTHLTLVKEGGYDIQATPMEAVSKAFERTRIDKILNYRKFMSCICV